MLRKVLVRALAPHAVRDLELEIDLLLGTIYFRFLVRRIAIPPRLADRLIP